MKKIIASEVNNAINENQFYDAFVQPFADVVQTAQHGLKSTIHSVVGNTRKVALQAATAMLPFIANSEVTRIGKEESARLKQKLATLDSKYADVLERNIDAIHHGNAATLAFMMNPAKIVTEFALMWAGGKAVSMGSDAAVGMLDFLEVLTAGVPKLSKSVEHLKHQFVELSEKSSEFADDTFSGPHHSGVSVHSGGGGDYDSGDGDYYGESLSHSGKRLLSEGDNKQQALQMKLGQKLSQLMANKQVLSVINSSKIANTLRNTAIETVLDRANKVAGFSTLDQFKAFAGPEFSKVKGKLDASLPKDLPEDKRKQFEADLMSELKKTYKTIYSNYLKQILAGTAVTPQENQKIETVLSKLS